MGHKGYTGHTGHMGHMGQTGHAGHMGHTGHMGHLGHPAFLRDPRVTPVPPSRGRLRSHPGPLEGLPRGPPGPPQKNSVPALKTCVLRRHKR